MSTDAPSVPPAPPGYLSEQSKQRFAVVAGVAGTAVFLAQMVLPMVVMFGLMLPVMFLQDFKHVRADHSAVWRDALWVTQETNRLDAGEPASESTSLLRLRVEDLEPAGAPVPLGPADTFATHSLLPIGERLWIVGSDAVRYYEGGSVTRLEGPGTRSGTSKPFAYRGAPAVLTYTWPARLSTLQVAGTQAAWTTEELELGLPPEAGALRGLEGLDVDGRLLLIAQLCLGTPERCSIHHRYLDGAAWTLASEQACACDWSVALKGAQPVVVAAEQEKGRQKRFSIVTLGSGAGRETLETKDGEFAWNDWRALSAGDRLFLVTGGFGDGVRLKEVADGRVVRSVRKGGSAFPFGPGMIAMFLVPQLLPIVLSIVLALVLTAQMRRHRVTEYVHDGHRRAFATLWQRALAQMVDAVPVAAAFAIPMVAFFGMFTDPERMAEMGPRFVLVFFGGFAAAFGVAGLVLLAYSYAEGRFGKTPGKWLMGIRVVGTDLQPCGFGRAFLRNLLTFVDGFFNFLVGALMVAFTENWQRLGDFAARTVVLADEKG